MRVSAIFVRVSRTDGLPQLQIALDASTEQLPILENLKEDVSLNSAAKHRIRCILGGKRVSLVQWMRPFGKSTDLTLPILASVRPTRSGELHRANHIHISENSRPLVWRFSADLLSEKRSEHYFYVEAVELVQQHLKDKENALSLVGLRFTVADVTHALSAVYGKSCDRSNTGKLLARLSKAGKITELPRKRSTGSRPASMYSQP